MEAKPVLDKELLLGKEVTRGVRNEKREPTGELEGLAVGVDGA